MHNQTSHTYIIVQNLSKTLGMKPVVRNLTFNVSKGTILGFLGPNGAGKSTTMRILVGCMKATSGSVNICGHMMDIDTQKAKSYIGYLPEHSPLYLDMYVLEYLQFMAVARGLGKEVSIKNSKLAVERCGLSAVISQKIHTLSKGYRQRVGLAQAIIHDPAVLVLDEPTTGLDPSQIVEIRNLIKELSENKAVILTTHIMQEVEALCSDVLILNRGELQLNQSLSDIRTRNDCKLLVEFKTCNNKNNKIDLSKIEFITNVHRITDTKFVLDTDNDIVARESIFLFAKEHDHIILELTRVGNTVEDVFKRAIEK
jgi:ABC-2 type transport system ATP-binding protein